MRPGFHHQAVGEGHGDAICVSTDVVAASVRAEQARRVTEYADESSDKGFEPDPNGTPNLRPANKSADPNAFHRVLELALYSAAPVTTLATAPILAHGLGPAGRGQYGVAVAVATLAVTLGSWGQAEIFLSRSRVGVDHYRLHSQITWLGGLTASVGCAAIMVALNLPLSAALVTAVWIPVLAQVGLWRSVSISRGQLKPPALDSAVGPLLRLCALSSLAALALLTVDSALFAYQAAMAVGSLVTVGLAARRSGLFRQRRSISTRTLLLSGSGIIAFNVLHAVTLRADLIVLQLTASPHEVGLYAAPASLTTAALALSTAYRPRIQAAAFSANPLREIVRNCLHVVALGTIGTSALWIATPRVVYLLFGSAFQDAVPLMRTLSLGIVPLLLVDLVFAALIVIGRQHDLLVAVAGSAGLTLAALSILCPLLGAQGAALATVISYSLSAIFGSAVLRRVARQGK